MITRIGIVSGEVWRLLEREGKLPLDLIFSKLEETITESEDVISMSIGWLAREGHIVLERKDSSYAVYLRKSSAMNV